MVLCCICGVEIRGPSHGGRCAHCLQREVNITDQISRRIHIQQCGTCGRYQRDKLWHICETESRELLALCLKAIKGISREHSLIDASFIWTEPHSKELKVKLTLQKEALAGVVIQQAVVVEIRVDSLQCSDCKKSFTKHTWESCVQVRQRADHRRTLLHLEQLILAHGAHENMIGLEHTKEGMDFFFAKHHDAQAFVNFVKSWAVVRHQDSKHLVSTQHNSNVSRFKRTINIEICPICKDDLVYLPPKTAQSMGGLPPLMLCTRATSCITLVDPASMRTVELSGAEFWKRPLEVACTPAHLTDFLVLDVAASEETAAPSSKSALKGRHRSAEVEVARLADLGQNDDRVTVRSHLGATLFVDVETQGYDLRSLSLNVGGDDLYPPLDVYLVRRKKKDKVRPSKLPSKAEEQREVCPEGHVLKSVTRAGYECDKCKKDIPENESFFDCRTCDWSVCQKCQQADVSQVPLNETHVRHEGEDDDDEDEEGHALEEAAADFLSSVGNQPLVGSSSAEAGDAVAAIAEAPGRPDVPVRSAGESTKVETIAAADSGGANASEAHAANGRRGPRGNRRKGGNKKSKGQGGSDSG